MLYLGGPEFCYGDLQSSYNFSNNVNQEIGVTLCGVPAPDLEWRVHGDTFMPARRTAVNSYTYEYLIELPELTQKICGRELVLNASGYKPILKNRTVFLTNCKYGNISPGHVEDFLDFLRFFHTQTYYNFKDL